MRQLVITLCFVGLVSHLQSQILKQEYVFSNPVIFGESQKKLIEIEGCLNKAINGYPLLPWKACNLVLPEGTQIERVEIITHHAETLDIDGIISPAGNVRPLSDYENRQEPTPNKQAYSKSVYMGQNYEDIEYSVHYLNNAPVLMFGLCPVKYNPVESKLIYHNKIEVKVYGTVGTNPSTLTENDLFLLNTFIDNPHDLPKVLSVPSIDNKIDVLIVTSNAFADELNPLKTAYRARGKKSTIVTTEEINGSYQGIDLAEKIRNCIKYYYQSKRINFVVLGGDTEIIPTRKLRGNVQSSSTHTEDIPSDLYYSALSGNWDSNQNGIYGEPAEADLLPELAIGRIPFSNTTELTNFLSKITKYAFSPVVSETNRPLLVGEHLWDNPLTWGAQYLDLIVGVHDDNGYTTQGIPPSDPYDSLYDRHQTWTVLQLLNKIDQGSSFIHHVGHANYNYLMRLDLGDLTNAFFINIDGVSHLNPLIYSHGCLAAAFDRDVCIAERMILLPNFASGFIGNSRYGWFNEGQTEGPSTHLHREFVHGLYGLGSQYLGMAHQVSQLRSAAWVDLPLEHEPGAQRWVHYACNILGDPVLPVWTSLPSSSTFSVVGNVYAGDNQITIVNIAGPKNYTVSLLDKNGKLYGNKSIVSDTTVMSLYPTVREPDTLFLISHGINILSDTVPVIFLQPTEPTLIYNGYEIHGNPQNCAISGKTSEMTITVKNIGLTSANQCIAVVSAITSGLQVEAKELILGDIEPNEVVSATETISFSVPFSIQNEGNIVFQIVFLISDNVHFTDYFHIPVLAPVLSLGEPSWDDCYGGNCNQLPEKGEVVTINIPLSNLGGAKTDSITALFTLLTGNCTVINPELKTDTLSPLQSSTLTCFLLVNEDSPVGDNILLRAIVSDRIFSDRIMVSNRANLPVEDFDNSAFNLQIWTNNSASPWTFSEGGLYGGHCMKSGNIGHSQSTEISTTITLNRPDVISFWLKVSCETSSSSTPYDYLEFLDNNQRLGIWGNNESWTKVAFSLTEGTHNLVWRYKKDYSGVGGADAAWIDRIVFPPVFDVPAIINQRPIISGLSDTTLQIEKNFNIPFTVEDADNDPVTVNIFNNPDWVTLSENSGQYQLVGETPVLPDIEYIFQVVATDGKQADGKSIKITTFDNTIILSEIELKTITVYPNPASTYFILDGLPHTSSGIITIVDTKGAIVYSRNHNSDGQGRVVIEKFSNKSLNGVYLLNYQFGNHKGTAVLLIN
ncbi:MAG TPA: C25 family cysteine peptidase [Salinivirgaceae bacterium]|nr:C25 family cysteine peptidase [Salinivirgaceae bacterium]